MKLHLDKDGNPLDTLEWAALFEDEEYKRIGLSAYPALEDLAAGDELNAEPVATISTVWIGINLQYGVGDPLIFETMIFGGRWDQEQMRYATEAQALEGHQRVVEDLREGRAPFWLADYMADHADGDSEGG
jgi:hypothetical protein